MSSTMGNEKGGGVPLRPKKIWSNEEDSMLIQILLELHATGKFRADRGFKPGLFLTVEKELEKRLPSSGIRADPHVYSRMKTLKNHFNIVHDMVYGSTSGFGWDPINKTVTAEKAVWDAYLQSHKNASQFRDKPFRYFDELAVIFGVDRAHGQGSVDFSLAEEIANKEEVNYDETGDDNYDNIYISVPQSPVNKSSPEERSAGIGRKRKATKDSELMDLLWDNTEVLVGAFQSSTKEICNAITRIEVKKDRALLNDELLRIEGLSYIDRLKAFQILGNNKDQLELFFSFNAEDREKWVRSLVAGMI